MLQSGFIHYSSKKRLGLESIPRPVWFATSFRIGLESVSVPKTRFGSKMVV